MAQKIYTWFSNEEWLERLPKRVSSAALALVDESDWVLVVKANYKDHWTFPGGIIDPGETPLQAAVRETHEETGLLVDHGGVRFVSIIDRMSDYAQSYQFIFQAAFPEELRQSITMEPSEIEDYEFVSREQIMSEDRYYAQSVLRWAKGVSGYIEQVIDVTATKNS